MIEFENVCFSYGEAPVIKDLSFTLPDGENLLITGPSGCGKSTVAKLILGLYKPQSGTVRAPGTQSAVFQEDRLIERLNVQRNILLPLKKPEYGLANSLIAEFGFENIKTKPIAALSGGMKRRVAIIRAIAYGGDAIILDEPFNGIDKENVRLIADVLNREYTEKKKSIIVISHNVTDAEYFSASVMEIKVP